MLMLVVIACGPPPVEWSAQRSDTRAGGSDSALALHPDGSLVPDTMVALASRVSAPPAPICPSSLRLASARGTLYAVWWSPRADSSARLLSAHSSDAGRSWSVPAPVDTTDRGVVGCRREPPAIAADPASGYVHVTYAMLAAEGPGIFFSHSMDGGASFHSPVPILYGDRLGRTSVAADGDLVVVGFEDPNSTMPRIGLAMSHTMGHIFEDRIVPVSDDNGAASRPLTAVRGRRVAVAWEQRASENAPAALAVRVGSLR
jgi:hypothetical protein